MPSKTIKFALLQTHVYAEKERCLEHVAELMDHPKVRGADFVTLPEMFFTPYQTELFPAYAEEEGGPSWRFCSKLAKLHGVWLSAGTMPERDAAGHVYNTAYVFDRVGAQVGKARKTHLFDIDVEGGQSFRESATLTPGDWIETFETEFCTMGLCVCFDFRFPEVGRLMAQSGAKVILVPAAFNMTTGPAHWELMFRQRAVEDQCWTVGTAPARDVNGSYVSWGHSIVCDPWGTVVQLDEKEGILTAELDLERVDAIRRQLPLMSARRTDLYNLEAADATSASRKLH